MLTKALITFCGITFCAAIDVRYGYALASNQQKQGNERALIPRRVDGSEQSFESAQVESSGFTDLPAGSQPLFSRSSDASYEDTVDELSSPLSERLVFQSRIPISPIQSAEEATTLETQTKKPNYLKPSKKFTCPFLNPWLDAVAHPDSDAECGHGMPGWRANPNCRCLFLVKDRDEFGCALKFFTQCRLVDQSTEEPERPAVLEPQPTWRLSDILPFKTTEKPRPPITRTLPPFTTTTTEIPSELLENEGEEEPEEEAPAEDTFIDAHSPEIIDFDEELLPTTTTPEPIITTTTSVPETTPSIQTTELTTTRRPTTTTTPEILEDQDDDNEYEDNDENGPGFDYVMGTRIVTDDDVEDPQEEEPEEEKEDEKVFVPKKFGETLTGDDGEFIIGHRYHFE